MRMGEWLAGQLLQAGTRPPPAAAKLQKPKGQDRTLAAGFTTAPSEPFPAMQRRWKKETGEAERIMNHHLIQLCGLRGMWLSEPGRP